MTNTTDDLGIQHGCQNAITADTTFPRVRLRGLFTARSPISHIGESVSTTSYLAQDPIVQPDGSVVEVFSYSGNAWRGQMRDLMARRVAEAVGVRLPIDAFHLLFSGGRIESDKGIDLEQIRTLRAALPPLSLLGGGIGSQMLNGKLRVTNTYPVCKEAMPVLPPHLHGTAEAIRYGGLTFEKEFSRRDDGRHADGLAWLADERVKGKKDGQVADQMRMGAELVAPGTVLYNEIHGAHLTAVELGCLVLALSDFSVSPYIGGQASRGHGLVDISYDMEAPYSDPAFVRVCDSDFIASPFALDCMALYLERLAVSQAELREVLKCAA
jgi:hypothetical protein